MLRVVRVHEMRLLNEDPSQRTSTVLCISYISSTVKAHTGVGGEAV